MGQQLSRCWGIQRKSDTPMAVHFTSYGGQFQTYMDKHSWKGWNVKVTAEPVQELFDPSQLVYLSPDATEVLEEVSRGKVYVIGGLVARSTRKVGVHKFLPGKVSARKVGGA